MPGLRLLPYLEQAARWPKSGRHILAHFDEATVVVYQAYRPSIGKFAVENGRFGGEFSFTRMSWIKPNFLWMMFRSGWATKPGQEVVLAISLKRAAFDEILRRAVPAAGDAEQASDRAVIYQWDPDHDPKGAPLERRALQIGLRGDALRSYAGEWIASVEDIAPWVATQRAAAEAGDFAKLVTPEERAYPLSSEKTAETLGFK